MESVLFAVLLVCLIAATLIWLSDYLPAPFQMPVRVLVVCVAILKILRVAGWL